MLVDDGDTVYHIRYDANNSMRNMIRYICLSTALSLNRNAAHRPIQREHYASASSAWECLNSDTGGALVARARGSWLRESITSETFVRWPTNTTSASAAPKASAPYLPTCAPTTIKPLSPFNTHPPIAVTISPKPSLRLPLFTNPHPLIHPFTFVPCRQRSS